MVATNVAIVPRLVSEELTTLEPNEVLSRALRLLIRKTPAVGRLRLPEVTVMPPANEDVALEPLMVVVAEPFPTVS